jgi:hypothetical protein
MFGVLGRMLTAIRVRERSGVVENAFTCPLAAWRSAAALEQAVDDVARDGVGREVGRRGNGSRSLNGKYRPDRWGGAAIANHP